MNTQSWIDYRNLNLAGIWELWYNGQPTGINNKINIANISPRSGNISTAASGDGSVGYRSFTIEYLPPDSNYQNSPIVKVGNMIGVFDDSDPTNLWINWKVPYATIRSSQNNLLCFSSDNGWLMKLKGGCNDSTSSNSNNKFTYDETTGFIRHASQFRDNASQSNTVYYTKTDNPADLWKQEYAKTDDRGGFLAIGYDRGHRFNFIDRVGCTDIIQSENNKNLYVDPKGNGVYNDQNITLWNEISCPRNGWFLYYGNGNANSSTPFNESNFDFDERYRWVRVKDRSGNPNYNKSKGGYGDIIKIPIWNSDGFKLGPGYKTYSSSQGSSSDGYCFIKVRFNKNFVDANNQPYKPDLIQFTVSNLDAGTDDNAIRYNVVVDSINQTDFVIRVSKWYKSWINSMRINWYAIKYL
jgi:hypothetical protein